MIRMAISARAITARIRARGRAAIGATVALTGATAASVAHAAEEAVEGTDATTGAFPPFETEGFASQLFWLALTFGFLYWFLSTRAIPRVETSLEGRGEVIEGGRTEARRLREEAEAAEAAYEQELATARRDAQRIAGEARDAANREAADARAASDAELDERLKSSEKRVAETKAAALAHVDEIATDVAQALVGKVAGVEASREEIAAAVAAQRAT